MRHRLFFLLVFTSLFLTSVSQALAESNVVFSSQVRGSECCDTGSVDSFFFQKKAFEDHGLPATFALRFDALREKKITDALKNSSFEAASFLEITPGLASASGVLYKGPSERWYKASNAYLVGYSVDDRKKMIDTYMSAFHSVFGTYPQSNVSWMIDSESLSYLQKKYHVSAQEITREQWGTDSYTLYGGPVNVPYYASVNWPLIPMRDPRNESLVLVVRQTLTDPRYTYGDEQSSFTSQPNDYMFGHKDFTYFTALIENALKSTYPKGFAVLGLETSMEQKYQDEFAKQIAYVATLRDQKKTNVVSLHQLVEAYPHSQSKASISAYISPDSDPSKRAFWITTPTYRARLIVNGQQVLMTDLRLYSDSLIDPYAATASSSINAYWTVPFLIDGSRYRSVPQQNALQKLPNFFSSDSTAKRGGTDFHTTENDFEGNATGLEFPDLKSKSMVDFSYEPTVVTISYPSDKGKVSLQFYSDVFLVVLPKGEIVHNTFSNPGVQSLVDQKDLILEQKTEEDVTTFRPDLAKNVTMQSLITSFPNLFLPESTQGSVDFSKSAFITGNRNAIAGRNPVRLVIRLVDDANIPAVSTEKVTVLLTDTSVKAIVHEPETAHGEYYIDLTAQMPTESDVIVSLGSYQHSFGTVYFVPNCMSEKRLCLKQPSFLFHYIQMKFDETTRKLRGR